MQTKVKTSPKIRWAMFLALAVLALAIRLPQLGERPMHTDESVNAYITGELLGGGYFHYDPQDRHGPALFALAEPLVKLLGAKNFSELTESQLRLTPVLVGSATVLLWGAGVEMFGFIPCLFAALLFAFAPLPVYYNRYFIHESLFLAATLGLILSGARALRTKAIVPAALAGFCAALMLACKETAVIHYFAIGVAAIIGWAWRARGGSINRDALEPEPNGARGSAGWPKLAVIAVVIFIFTAVVLFTWFGRNWSVFAKLLRAVPNFAARAGGEGHEKPFWYYLRLLGGGWSGPAILAVAAIGLIRARLSGARVFLAVYGLLIFAIYSAIPYKTPWLALNFWLPIAVLAGLSIECLWRAATRFPVFAALCTGVTVLGFLIAHDTYKRAFLDPAGERNPYAYAHTVPDLLRLAPRLEELAGQDHLASPRIAVVAADPWPLPWYLRKFPQTGFWQPGQDPGPANFFITSPEAAGNLGDKLENFRPEFFGVRPEVLFLLWTPEGTNAAAEPGAPLSKP
jgi:uncharacterized protein (TIGR03663 family)